LRPAAKLNYAEDEKKKGRALPALSGNMPYGRPRRIVFCAESRP
jgi:hypothetical protein